MHENAVWLRRVRMLVTIGVIAWIFHALSVWALAQVSNPYVPPTAPYVSVDSSALQQYPSEHWIAQAFRQVIDFWRFGN